MEHNFSEEIAHTRDTFLAGELNFLKQLIQVPGFFELYEKYKNIPLNNISIRLLTLIEMMENGQIKEDDEAKVELEIMCCCLAIEDATKKKGSKVLTPESKQGINHSKHR